LHNHIAARADLGDVNDVALVIPSVDLGSVATLVAHAKQKETQAMSIRQRVKAAINAFRGVSPAMQVAKQISDRVPSAKATGNTLREIAAQAARRGGESLLEVLNDVAQRGVEITFHARRSSGELQIELLDKQRNNKVTARLNAVELSYAFNMPSEAPQRLRELAAELESK